RDRRTPKVHQDVLTALIEIASAPPVESKKLLERPAAIEMLRYFAEFDDQIRYWVATMYLQLARAMLAAHDDGASITYLEQSYAMQMENVESRRNVLIALSQQAESNESDSGLHDRLRTLRVAEGLEVSKTEERRVGIIRVITLILTLILIVVVARWILRKLRNYRSLKQEQQSRHQLLAEREELRELLIFFGLTAKSSLEDLAKRYRAKAKLIHPDRPDGDPVRFKQLTQRFERTRELMERYSLREK
ncbi:MAG: hypothetical protein KDD44_10520, partial [Bdellovibrionales bacterium]|nr:hypothetical protein [Bdellovibrionales bacterium]